MISPDTTASGIGGYFELELPRQYEMPYQGSMRFQSARSAFLALLRAGKPKRIWMPKFICDSMLVPLERETIEIAWYEVNDKFAVESELQIGRNDWLLYVNYFGVCNNNVTELSRRFSPQQLVLDYSQAFFDAPEKSVVATIYSPRKFFGVPDGGILVSQMQISLPDRQDVDSIERTSHLIKRLGDTAESGYADFQRAESSLANCEPKRMSKLSEKILASVDFESIGKRRRENFSYLHRLLGKSNLMSVDQSQVSAPLCYPYITKDADLRNRLIENKVFVATYWPDAAVRVGKAWAEKMVAKLLPLPIDQRYGRADMQRIASLILGDES